MILKFSKDTAVILATNALIPAVAEPPKCLGPPAPVIVPKKSDGDAGDPPTIEVR